VGALVISRVLFFASSGFNPPGSPESFWSRNALVFATPGLFFRVRRLAEKFLPPSFLLRET
jgi:hypothetical protein